MTEDLPRVGAEGVAEAVEARSAGWPRLVPVHRRSPLLRAARGAAESGIFGLDLTAGCVGGCPFCHIRGAPRYPGEGRVLFDPGASLRLGAELDGMSRPPRLVVLSPTSDPLPP